MRMGRSIWRVGLAVGAWCVLVVGYPVARLANSAVASWLFAATVAYGVVIVAVLVFRRIMKVR